MHVAALGGVWVARVAIALAGIVEPSPLGNLEGRRRWWREQPGLVDEKERQHF